jgi:hypothetical protein
MPRRPPTAVARTLHDIRAGLTGMRRDRRPFDVFVVLLAVGLAASGAVLGAALVLVWGAWVRGRVDPQDR